MRWSAAQAAQAAQAQREREATEQSTKAEIAEAITHLAAYAARLPHHRDCSRWVRAHQRIDALLDDYERAPE